MDADSHLVALAQRGDRAAFAQLVTGYQQRVVNLVYNMCGDMGTAEDAAQEAFLRAWQHLPRYRPQAPFHSWLYRIAINAARDGLRRRRPELDVDDLPLTTPEQGPEESLELLQRQQQIRRCVLALPEASREVLVLREYDGLSYREIADVLGVPMGTVMSRLNYARTRLREMLAPYREAL